MKVAISTAVLLVAISPLAFAQSDLQRAIQVFTTLRDELTGVNKISDILFLLDTSASLSDYHFDIEKKFVINFLSTISVSFEKARVAVIPFGNTASLYIDGVSNPSLDKHKCDLIQKLTHMPHGYAWVTNTKSAFQLAYDVCVGQYSAKKRGPFHKVRTVVILVTDGWWNWPYNDPSPIPIAQSLLAANVEVFAIGVGYVNLPALQKLVKDPAKQAFHFKDFAEFGELSLFVRGDPFGTQLQPVEPSNCNNLCDPIAHCACHLVYAHYWCLCPEGFEGSGTVGQCHRLPDKKKK